MFNFKEGGKISFDYENKMYAHVARYMNSNGQIGEFKHIHNYNTVSNQLEYIINSIENFIGNTYNISTILHILNKCKFKAGNS